MSYREHARPSELAPWLECTWERRGDGLPVRVLPDGCIDVIWTEGADTQLVGASTTAFVVPLRTGAHVVGARFRPGAAPALLGVAAEEVRDARIEVGHAVGERRGAALLGARGPAATLFAVCSAGCPGGSGTRASPTRSCARPCSSCARSPAWARRRRPRRSPRSPSSSPSANVSCAAGSPPRSATGPKRLARDPQAATARSSAARAGEDLGRVAHDAGYADQAHFANECRVLAGAPATVVLAGFAERDRFLQDTAAPRREHAAHERF